MKIVCQHCGERRMHKARGLCDRCWRLLWKEGALSRYPLPNEAPERYYCVCERPLFINRPDVGHVFCNRCGLVWFSEGEKEELRCIARSRSGDVARPASDGSGITPRPPASPRSSASERAAMRWPSERTGAPSAPGFI